LHESSPSQLLQDAATPRFNDEHGVKPRQTCARAFSDSEVIGLLSPRLWIGLALVAALTFSHFSAYRKGRNVVKQEWLAAVSAANEEARRLERARQSRVDDAQKLAAKREADNRAAARRAASAADSLRNTLNAANEYAKESRAAAERVARVSSELLGRCTAEYLGVAEAAARADSEARELRQGWPKD
jgi:flagellar biosynthesis GTPase FlhF